MDYLVNEYFTNTSRSSKSRKTSYSSLMNDPTYGTSKLYQEKRSLKKLAKQYSRSLWNSGGYHSKVVSNPESNQQMDSSKFESFSLLQNMTKRYKNKEQVQDASSRLNLFGKVLANHGNNETQTHQNSTKGEETKGSDPIDIPHNKNVIKSTQVRPNSAESLILRRNNNIDNLMSKLDINSSNYLSNRGKRIIQFRDYNHLVGINSLLSQISGGPLEKLVIYGESLKSKTVELWFLKSDDACEFLEYSLSGLFLVNGFHLKAEWAPRAIGENFYHAEPDYQLEDEMVINGASRCLILKKHINKKPSNKKTYPAPLKNFSDDLKLSEIRQDLSKFGEIIDISPVVSKKLSIAIYFFETQSAIAAKREFDDQSNEFYQKYKDWTFWYGKDPCDRPCLSV